MAEATQRLQQHKLRASMAVATWTLALQAAMWAIKRQLKAQGLKVSHFPHRELVTRAEQYLADHCEALITEAKALVEQWRVQGSFGKRAAQMAFINNRSLNSPSSQGAILMDNSPRPPTPPTTVNRTMRCPNAELRTREHLTTQEVEALIEAAGKSPRPPRCAHDPPSLSPWSPGQRGLRSSVGANRFQSRDLACAQDRIR